jgi:hypothetical protein
MKKNGGVEVQFHSYLMSALDKGECSCCFNLGKEPRLAIRYEAGWAPKPVWKLWRREKSLTPVGNWTTIPWSCNQYSSHYTDWAGLVCFHVASWININYEQPWSFKGLNSTRQKWNFPYWISSVLRKFWSEGWSLRLYLLHSFQLKLSSRVSNHWN